MSTTDFVGRIQKVESGGRRFGKDGKILEGPQTRYGTAKGEMQVLDSTNRSPGFGVTPARDGSPEERARVGADYAQAMLREFGGDEALAAAAYNHGPGNVRKLLEKHGNDWVEYLPTETKNYVAKVSGDQPVPQVQAQPVQPVQVAQAPVPVSVQPVAPQEQPYVPLPEERVAVVTPQAHQVSQPVGDAMAWVNFLKNMPGNKQPVAPQDLDFTNTMPTLAANQFPLQPVATGTRPNFAAFSSWGRGRTA